MPSLLDANQVIQQAFDDASGSLIISGTGPGGAIPITGSSSTEVKATYNISYSNLTTSYYQVVASTADAISSIAIYDTSGETIELAVGGSGSEVVLLTIGPGCDQILPVSIDAGSRIAVRTVGSNASAGSLILNAIGTV